MPKRKSVESEEERWRRKMKKYESKLNEKRRRHAHRVIYSSDEDYDIIEDHLEGDRVEPVEPTGSLVQCTDYAYNDAIENQLEDEPAILADPSASVVDCTADVHVDAVPTPSNADGQNNVDTTKNNPDDVTNVVTEDFDPELLRVLGEFETDTVEWGENIHEDIAKHFQHILLNGLKKEAKEDLNKKYLFPKNVPLSKAPTLNPEIAAMLTEACRNRDKRILAKQEQIGRALSGLGKAMTMLLKKEANIAEVIRILNDVGKFVADAHFAETDTRRSVVIPLVEKSLIDPFKDRKRDNFLFGEKLGDLVKSSRGIKKTGQLIQATSTASTSSPSLNWKAPPSRGRYQRGGQLPYPSRGGGQRGAYQHYQQRRRAPPGPTPAARRPPPPPPPPPRRQPAQAPRPATSQPQT